MEISINTEHILNLEISNNDLSIDGASLLEQIRDVWAGEDNWCVVSALDIARFLLRAEQYNEGTANAILDEIALIASGLLWTCKGLTPATQEQLKAIRNAA